MRRFEVTTDGETIVGPVTLDQVRRGLASGKLPPDARIREVGEWQPVLASIVWTEEAAVGAETEVIAGWRATALPAPHRARCGALARRTSRTQRGSGAPRARSA